MPDEEGLNAAGGERRSVAAGLLDVGEQLQSVQSELEPGSKNIAGQIETSNSEQLPTEADTKHKFEEPRAGAIAVEVGMPAASETRFFVPGAGKTEWFKDLDVAPEMVVVPAGSFMMGSPESEIGRSKAERSQHRVELAKPFAVGRFAVTFDEWDACVDSGGGNGYKPKDNGWGRGRRPVINVSWNDARAYVDWLAEKTGKPYRLLSEAEWEYGARAGSTTAFWWGNSISRKQANYAWSHNYPSSAVVRAAEYPRRTLPVNSFEPNPWGLYQVHGNVWEWTDDWWHGSYAFAPTDGSAWTSGSSMAAQLRVFRGGSWYYEPKFLRSAYRFGKAGGSRSNDYGFRVARTLIGP